MTNRGQVLLINPWIYDFAAHNVWIEPLGLLSIASVLRENEYAITIIDCLAPLGASPGLRSDGCGKFYKTVLDKPQPVADIPRRYGRYGLPVDQFAAALAAVPSPDVVLVASGMTYWYPGVIAAIRHVRLRFGPVPVALGGIYATLCPEHARHHTGADEIISGPGVAAALSLVDSVTGHDSDPVRYTHARTWPAPDHTLVARLYAGVVTSWGCPYRCSYCGSHRLQPTFVQRCPSAVSHEIVSAAGRGITDFAFYDDALLLDADKHLIPILDRLLREGVTARFHTPNGLHAGQVTPELASWMRRAGFATVRLSLETLDHNRQRSTGAKITTGSFEQAARYLREAGFRSRELGAYVLAGLPGQPLSEVEATVRFVQGVGLQAKLALFSPIPGTPDGDAALPADADPLLHNNTVYPYLLGRDYVHELERIKLLAKEGNARLTA